MQGEGLKPDPGSYKFLADAMLGKLALWMRAAGYDTAYERAIGDAELVRRAAAGRRVILTRDTLLILRKRARGNYLFIESDKWREQLGQVLGVYPIGKEKSLTRCLRCNTLLEDIPRASIKAGKAGKTGAGVPPYVLETHKRFSACRLCGRIYWAGTHRDEIMKELELVREAAGLDKGGIQGRGST